MPLLQYFGWVGSFLVAALLAANWCFAVPIVRSQPSDVPLNQKINIRIHTDHKWPEPVVFDTARSTLPQKARAKAQIVGSETPVLADPLDAFAEMSAMRVKPCFRPPCFAGRIAEREDSPIEKSAEFQNRRRMSTAARKDLTFPNLLHKLPGKS
jgi:hypothetical protein